MHDQRQNEVRGKGSDLSTMPGPGVAATKEVPRLKHDGKVTIVHNSHCHGEQAITGEASEDRPAIPTDAELGRQDR